jgi:hypothetical protein
MNLHDLDVDVVQQLRMEFDRITRREENLRRGGEEGVR